MGVALIGAGGIDFSCLKQYCGFDLRIVFGTGTLPFLIGASLSFPLGLMVYYRSCMTRALQALEDYPSLMLLHLKSSHPKNRWDPARVNAVVQGSESGWVNRGMVITAWLNAGAALDVS